MLNEINAPEILLQVNSHDRLDEAIREKDYTAAKKWTAEYLNNIVDIIIKLF